MNNIKWQAAREAQCLSKLAAYDNQTLITNNTNKKETNMKCIGSSVTEIWPFAYLGGIWSIWNQWRI